MATNNCINTYIVPTTNNEVTMPSQPAFLAYLDAGDTDADVTGNGTVYQLGSGNALTEVFDQNSDFNTNGTFTAPVTGRYFLSSSITFLQAGAGTTAGILITTSNRTYRYEDSCNTSAANNGSILLSALADMDSADTATTSIFINGIGADTADSFGSATLYTSFKGNLKI